MAHGTYIQETEFLAIKKLLGRFGVSEVDEILNSNLKKRALKTIREIDKYGSFLEYQTRNTEPVASVTLNGAKFTGPLSECIEVLQKAKK